MAHRQKNEDARVIEDDDAIGATLAHYAGPTPDAQAMANATLVVWQLIRTHLTPMIGERGVDVLLSRALHLASTTYAGLGIDGIHDSIELQRHVQAALAGQTADRAGQASHCLLTIFTELLADLIGDSLTARLLAPVWATPPDRTEESAP
ncbi:hypothetical protein HCX48_02140 [Rhodocyclus tenuis]|uniref:DUF2267 domain-containing protein n=1 Tax=Rhodocyclus gracilis TaxID=2929842 RepID=A0ABX0WF75_9RHOO|nr:hypothetical protein [Rhodocyclus gracilis]NJA88025.1 hypothetical protein [Rhodocyclus gracilis]